MKNPLKFGPDEIDIIVAPLLDEDSSNGERLSDPADRQLVNAFTAHLPESWGSSDDFVMEVRKTCGAASRAFPLLEARTIAELDRATHDDMIERGVVLEILRRGLQSYGSLINAVRDRMLSITNLPRDGEHTIRYACKQLKRDAAESIRAGFT